MARDVAKVASRPTSKPRPMSLPACERTRLKHIARLRAERHANTDFAGALHHAVSHHAVNSDCGDDERNNRKTVSNNIAKRCCEIFSAMISSSGRIEPIG